MKSLLTYTGISTVLQVLMVVAGHGSEVILAQSAFLGTGIPFIVGGMLGAKGGGDAKKSSIGGFVQGIVGAAIGVFVAIQLGDADWSLMSFAPLSSGVTGLLGGLLGYAAIGKKRLES